MEYYSQEISWLRNICIINSDAASCKLAKEQDGSGLLIYVKFEKMKKLQNYLMKPE